MKRLSSSAPESLPIKGSSPSPKESLPMKVSSLLRKIWRNQWMDILLLNLRQNQSSSSSIDLLPMKGSSSVKYLLPMNEGVYFFSERTVTDEGYFFFSKGFEENKGRDLLLLLWCKWLWWKWDNKGGFSFNFAHYCWSALLMCGWINSQSTRPDLTCLDLTWLDLTGLNLYIKEDEDNSRLGFLLHISSFRYWRIVRDQYE